MNADIAVITPQGQPELIVEVKAKKGTSAQWASEYRRNLLAHSPWATAPFLLLATPEHFYFWKQGVRRPDLIEPDFTLDSSPILAKYGQTNRDVWTSPTEFALQFVVADWLRALTWANEKDPAIPGWISTSGLLHALQRGRVTLQADV
jgi:hypothetical protein